MRPSPSDASRVGSAALSRRTGVSRDQPPEIQAASSGERPSQKTRALLGVGHGWRPLAEAGTAQRGEWPTSPASSGRRGPEGRTSPRRGLALPGRDGEWAKKRCPNAHLAQRQRLGRVAALPPPCPPRTRPWPGPVPRLAKAVSRVFHQSIHPCIYPSINRSLSEGVN